ncbi:glycosyltransferase [Lysobacter sp. D1-1-M9]
MDAKSRVHQSPAEHYSELDPPSPAVVPPRRVLYMVSLFPSWSETFIVREISALIEDGVDVRILSLKRRTEALVHSDAAALLERVRQPQGSGAGLWKILRALLTHPVRILAAAATIVAGTWRQPGVLLKSLGALARALEHLEWLRQFDPELIHAHWANYPSTAAWALSRIIRRPFGFTSHAHDIFVNGHLLRRKLQDAALAVTISRHNVEWFDRNVSATAHEKLKVVHCGVDLQHIEWQPEGRNGQLIVAVGRLHPIKGFDTLIEALALAWRGGARFRCRIIGEGPLRAELQALVHARGLDDCIELAGAQPQEVVRAALREAAVFALPSQVAADGGRDGIPVALMEAMASGCAVVSCRTSGIPELISDGQQGLLVPERDAPVLAGALQRLLGDAILRRRLASAARQRVEQQFDARHEAGKLRRLMTNALTAEAATDAR